MYYRVTLLVVVLPLMAAPAQAGLIFGRKKEKPDPRQRVPELVTILKTDKDADKRSRAAEELRSYDPALFPDIVPALIEALRQDRKAGVRIEAAHSLARVRPVSPVVGEALELAVAKDPSMRVRLQARSALLQYHWAGYRGKKNDMPPLNTSREPPLAGKDHYPPPISTRSPTPPIDSYRLRPVSVPSAPPSTREPPLSPAPIPAPKPNTTSEGPDLGGPPLP